jgi:predicted GIY-YIG superfamily endonuclease
MKWRAKSAAPCLWRRRAFLFYNAFVASYGSASQQEKMEKFTYVYILQSKMNPNCFYTGITRDLRERLIRHNSGKVPHTAKSKPWRVKTYIAFSDAQRAIEFGRYLKSASGRAFLKKHP